MNQMLKLLRPAGNNRMLDRRVLGHTAMGEPIVAQAETCGNVVRMVLVVGISLYYTCRASNVARGFTIITDFVAAEFNVTAIAA